MLVGIYYAVKLLESDPEAPGGHQSQVVLFTLRATQTVALLVWVGTAFAVTRPILQGLAGLADRVTWIQSRTVPLLDNFGRVVLFLLAIYMLLVIWEWDVTPWIASAGVVGLAFGFAAKDSLANLFGGLSIIIDTPYSIGDYIVLESGERGAVTKIGLRSTRLLTRDDIEITVPNAQIAAAKIINEAGGHTEKSRVRVKVGVAYGSEVQEVKDILMQASDAVEYALADPEPRVRLRELGDSSLNFELLAWIEKPELRGRCVDALLTEIYNRLNAAGVGIPFPQREVHLVQPAQPAGDAAR
ncbi:MAG: mechanosensitive ion channel family protein [Planctomycetota bacterium]|nr:mechanosensitive ion channel family protein [Planctomycetota bacterium]